MIKCKRLLLSLNVLVALVVMVYGLTSVRFDPISMIITTFVTLTTLILVNLVYFDCEHFVLDLIDKVSRKASMGTQASHANQF